MVFAINITKPRTRLTAEAAVALSQHGTLAPQFVADRTDYAAAKADGLTAQEVEPNGPSANEISQRASMRSCGVVAYADTDAGMESTSGQRDSWGMSGCPRRATDRVHRSGERLPTFHLEAETDARDRVVVCEHDIRRILAKREFKAG